MNARGSNSGKPIEIVPWDVERFWKRVKKSDSGCWEWTGEKTSRRDRRQYGRFVMRGPRRVPAHRFSFALNVAPLTPGLCIDHRCRNPLCVNPAHLEEVTTQENIRRGHGVNAVNSAKSNCPRGHEYELQVLFSGRRRRVCRRCESITRSNRAASLSPVTVHLKPEDTK